MRFLKVEKAEPRMVPGYQDIAFNETVLLIDYLNSSKEVCGMKVICTHENSAEALKELINSYIESDKRDIDDGK